MQHVYHGVWDSQANTSNPTEGLLGHQHREALFSTKTKINLI